MIKTKYKKGWKTFQIKKCRVCDKPLRTNTNQSNLCSSHNAKIIAFISKLRKNYLKKKDKDRFVV